MLGIIKNPPWVSSAQASPEEAEDHEETPWELSTQDTDGPCTIIRGGHQFENKYWRNMKKRNMKKYDVQEEIQNEEMVDAILSRWKQKE